MMVVVIAAVMLTAARSGAVAINPGSGLNLSQFDLTFALAPQPDSDMGLAAVDIPVLTANTGISNGYLNIATAAGWVVQNMPIDLSSGHPGIAAMFQLGNTPGTDVSNITVSADLSPTPLTSFAPAPTTLYSVGNLNYNAQGRNAPVSSVLAGPVVPTMAWNLLAPTVANWQPFRTSVEQDDNQCGPGSVANSLQYLEDTYGINVPDKHIPGINGQPPDSLVGEIDTRMKRTPHQPVTDANFMAGKLEYIGENGLGDDLILKHWGGTFAPGDKSYTGTQNVTSKDESLSGISLIDWIIKEIEHGEDVELALGAPGTGHWINITGAGKIAGIPWISWTHDADQGYDNHGTATNADDTTLPNGGVNWWDGGVGWTPIIDGKPVFFLDGFTLDFAVSESVPDPSSLAAGLLTMLLITARRRR